MFLERDNVNEIFVTLSCDLYQFGVGCGVVMDRCGVVESPNVVCGDVEHSDGFDLRTSISSVVGDTVLPVFRHGGMQSFATNCQHARTG